MTRVDRLLQSWRIAKAAPHLPPSGRILDLGTGDGALFRRTGRSGVGLDPELEGSAQTPPGVSLVRAAFPADAHQLGERFAGATALAVVEHVPDGELLAWSDALTRLLMPGGRLVITVPAPAVDRILHVLMALRLVDGMQAHEHHGFEPSDLRKVFAGPTWELVRHARFQLGLNHLFVFRLVSPAP